jgi:serine phosphatase RsbU (regulator of sigma subunit)
VLYTDGLVESRERDVEAGTTLLLEACANAASTDPETLADGIVSALAGGERSDDVALLVVQRTGEHDQ